MPVKQAAFIESSKPAHLVFTGESLFKEFKRSPKTIAFYESLVQIFLGASKKPETEDEKKAVLFFETMLSDMLKNKLVLLSGSKFTEENIDGILIAANKNKKILKAKHKKCLITTLSKGMISSYLSRTEI